MSVVLKTCWHSCVLSVVGFFGCLSVVAALVARVCSAGQRRAPPPRRDGAGEGFPRREGDGDRPEEAVLGGHLVRVADALPVRLPHEAVEGRESPDPQHDEGAGLAAGQRDLLEAVRLPALVLARLPLWGQASE